MDSKKLYRIINEEMSGFDFLGIEKNQGEDIHDDIISSKEFQTSFIIDLINNPNNKDKFKKKSAIFVNKDTDMFNDYETIELEIDITYRYNEKDYNLILFLDGTKKDDEVLYDQFDMKIFSKAGDQIKFDWVHKNEKLYNTLIKSIVSPFID